MVFGVSGHVWAPRPTACADFPARTLTCRACVPDPGSLTASAVVSGCAGGLCPAPSCWQAEDALRRRGGRGCFGPLAKETSGVDPGVCLGSCLGGGWACRRSDLAGCGCPTPDRTAQTNAGRFPAVLAFSGPRATACPRRWERARDAWRWEWGVGVSPLATVVWRRGRRTRRSRSELGRNTRLRDYLLAAPCLVHERGAGTWVAAVPDDRRASVRAVSMCAAPHRHKEYSLLRRFPLPFGVRHGTGGQPCSAFRRLGCLADGSHTERYTREIAERVFLVLRRFSADVNVLRRLVAAVSLSINGQTPTSRSSPRWKTPRRCSAKGSRNSSTRPRESWSLCRARWPLAY